MPNVRNKNLEFPEDLQDDIGTYFYCPGFFYYEDYVLLDTANYRIENIGTYYKQIPSPVETNETQLYNINGKLYIPLDGSEYSYDGTQVDWGELWGNIYVKSGKIALDKSTLMTKGRQYYAVFTEIDTQNASFVIDDDGNLVPAISSTAYNISTYRINMMPYLGNKYYRIDKSVITYYHAESNSIISEEDYEELTDEIKETYSKILSIKSYALMTESSAELALEDDYNKQFKQQKKEFVDYYELDVNATDAFYGPNKYWYNTFEDKLATDDEKNAWEHQADFDNEDNDEDDNQEEDTAFAYGDWIIDTNKVITPKRRYYLQVISYQRPGPYYRPYYYYYYDSELQKYVLDDSPTMRKNTIYYKKNNFYVLDDKTGKFSKGAIWKYVDSGIPCVIKIASRISVYEMQELVGFARTFNTIHGLILQINNLLELNDSLTRNTRTVQGCINTLNDIINKFDELEFNKILATDQTGQVITKDLGDFEIIYGANNKKKSLAQICLKIDELEERLDNIVYMTDEEMNTILNS